MVVHGGSSTRGVMVVLVVTRSVASAQGGHGGDGSGLVLPSMDKTVGYVMIEYAIWVVVFGVVGGNGVEATDGNDFKVSGYKSLEISHVAMMLAKCLRWEDKNILWFVWKFKDGTGGP
ncbi:hypothetical protein M8C21_014198 [Ambrosia artemisiifolia]|uniref:Uncharacterized protein n=1 Tax=Ambrosia artemisiifolia TaxID=4212 RepID=A0AAD5C6S1_AMBAR|nr:hypothetical protein M8C21_014198 [Ambrosia artemisiifolia]